ncbi:hypothetical protein PSI23_14025 [Xenorhabdus sp. XENO-10]|uniref:Uncharacterized protein n=1 Tax=Xenorhabdus yunnanensis TaxID=3025878 RepID=A0ABT5LHF8_9GAMM|nr:hypothetical protein [Xenorhabdus yunnanensis]MDC9590379.1 hypothetical protein [Xenorhabdus yunnanensis]
MNKTKREDSIRKNINYSINKNFGSENYINNRENNKFEDWSKKRIEDEIKKKRGFA